jgi:hypothetical protein
MTVVASNFDRKENDLYQTEEWATRALLKHIPPIKGMGVWEPAAGNHKIADVLRAEGANVFTSDIATYDRKHDENWDFFAPKPKWFSGSIITNPPYGKGNRDAARFARTALEKCDAWIALLLTAKFDFGKTRLDLFRDNPRFHSKIVLVDRIQWFPGETSGTEDHAWYVWSDFPPSKQFPTIYYEGREGNER